MSLIGCVPLDLETCQLRVVVAIKRRVFGIKSLSTSFHSVFIEATAHLLFKALTCDCSVRKLSILVSEPFSERKLGARAPSEADISTARAEWSLSARRRMHMRFVLMTSPLLHARGPRPLTSLGLVHISATPRPDSRHGMEPVLLHFKTAEERSFVSLEHADTSSFLQDANGQLHASVSPFQNKILYS